LEIGRTWRKNAADIVGACETEFLFQRVIALPAPQTGEQYQEQSAPFNGNHDTEPNREAAQLCKTAEPQ
jgi:hypothetical protein